MTRPYGKLVPMTLAIVAIGIPGAGKTTVLKPLSEKYGLAYVSRDDIRETMLGAAEDQSRNKEVWEEANRRTVSALRAGTSVVLDSTFVEEWKRKEVLRFLRESGADRVIGLYFDTPFGIAKERNRTRERTVPDDVLESMRQKLLAAPPSLHDGFDAFYLVGQIEKFEGELTRLNGPATLAGN